MIVETLHLLHNVRNDVGVEILGLSLISATTAILVTAHPQKSISLCSIIKTALSFQNSKGLLRFKWSCTA
jgi:hypothetical protein